MDTSDGNEDAQTPDTTDAADTRKSAGGSTWTIVGLAALFLAYLRKGADLMSMKTDMQTDFVSVIQAVILIFLLAEQFLAGYRQKKTYELSKKLEECEA